MNRKIVRKLLMSELPDYEFVPGTPEERLAMYWPMIKDICSLNPEYDVERRLQRHVTRLIRRKG